MTKDWSRVSSRLSGYIMFTEVASSRHDTRNNISACEEKLIYTNYIRR